MNQTNNIHSGGEKGNQGLSLVSEVLCKQQVGKNNWEVFFVKLKSYNK